MRPRTRTRHYLGAAFAVALVALVAGFGRPTVAYAQLDGDHLGGSQMRLQDRAALLREEARERRREIREAIEHAKKAKHARGRHAEQIPSDSDLLPANLAAGFSLPAGISQMNLVPTNTQANNKTGDATGTSAAGQAEQSIAFLGQNGLCAWNDGQGFNLTPQDVQGWGYTTNGGATWTDGGIPPKSGTISTWTSDPVVSVNEKTGEFYYCGLTSNTGTNNNGLAVARGHFSGASFLWDGVSVVSAGPSASKGYDKEWVAADSSTGNVYCTWTVFTTTGDDIWFARSTDGGATWGTAIQVSGSWETGLCSGSRPALGPNGEVYVTYSAYGPVDADSVKITKSTNAGVSFLPSVGAGLVMDNYFTGAPGFNRGRAVTFPSIAVDRSTGCNRGRVYIAIQQSVNFYGDTFPALTNANYVPEIENNGNFKNATPFTVGKNLRGAIGTSTDIDNWKFPATQGTTYVFFADSVRTTTFKYTMRLYCPNDTTVLSRLALSSDGSSSSSTNVHAIIVWTCPSSGTYYLRMQYSTSTGGYRIRTTTHTPAATDYGRDTRDAGVFSSADGYSAWSPNVRINDDAALYDNWLPEVAVANDGKAYAMWFDWRDAAASCFGGSNIYLSRSTDGGATWAPNQVATSAQTVNWTQVASNIAPNQGDYNGMYGGDSIGLAWADGRLGDSDVFTAHVATGYTLTGCPADQLVNAGATVNTSSTINNLNTMFGNSYNYTITVNRSWPGYPASGTAAVASLSSGSVPVTISVPDSAANGEVVQVCVGTSLCGALAQSCCFNVTVTNLSTATLASLVSSTAEPGQVSLRWMVGVQGTVNVYRSTDGTSWSNIGQATAQQGYVTMIDTQVQGGSRYSYRLGLPTAGGETYAGQTWVSVPVTAEFALGHAFPSPAKSGFSVSFSLPNNAPATLDVIDLAGRRVLSRSVGTMGAGRHTLSLESETGNLPIGIYAVRLTQGGHVASCRVTIIR